MCEVREAFMLDEVSDAVGQDTRLARAGARHHEEWTLGVHDGIELCGVEAADERGSVRIWRHQRHPTCPL